MLGARKLQGVNQVPPAGWNPNGRSDVYSSNRLSSYSLGTVNLWVKATGAWSMTARSAGDPPRQFTFRIGGDGSSANLRMTDLGAAGQPNSSQLHNFSISNPQPGWNHYAFTYNGQVSDRTHSVSLYYNGLLKGTTAVFDANGRFTRYLVVDLISFEGGCFQQLYIGGRRNTGKRYQELGDNPASGGTLYEKWTYPFDTASFVEPAATQGLGGDTADQHLCT